MISSKKIILSIFMIAVISMAMLAGGCLFNNGSEDEVSGIYGIKAYYYDDVKGNNNNYADDYDYYLLILRDDRTATITYKKVEGEEYSYNTTYYITFDADDSDKVSSITIINFQKLNFSGAGESVRACLAVQDTTFNFHPMAENFTYKKTTWKKNDMNRLVIVTDKLSFNRIYGSVSEKKVERAKQKQINSISDRSSTESEDE